MNPADVQKMTRRELAKAVSALSSAANKRLQRLESIEAGMLSPAYQSQMKTGVTRFTAKDKNINQLRNEFKNVTGFLNLKTSTVSGFSKYVKNIEKHTGYGFSNAEELSDFLTLFGKLRAAVGRSAIQQAGSDIVQQWLRQEMINPYNKTDMEVIQAVIARMNDMYESIELERLEREAGYGDFYEFDDDEGEDLPF